MAEQQIILERTEGYHLPNEKLIGAISDLKSNVASIAVDSIQRKALQGT
jgi:hypothetical protein